MFFILHIIVYWSTLMKELSSLQVFEVFLKHHRLFSKYKRELEKGYPSIFYIEDLLDCAFSWEETGESDLWFSLDLKWYKLLYYFELPLTEKVIPKEFKKIFGVELSE